MTLKLASTMDERKPSILLHDLPDSIIVYKFTIKERLLLRGVCWNWHHLLNDYSVWKKIDLTEDSLISSKVNNKILESWVAAWVKTIQHINVSDCKWLTDLVIHKVAENCLDLRSLNIKGCFQVSDCGMDEIAFNRSRLRKLKWCLRRGLCQAAPTVHWPGEYQAWQQRQLLSYAIVCVP